MEYELNGEAVAGPICMSPHSMRHKQPMTSMREGVWCMVANWEGSSFRIQRPFFFSYKEDLSSLLPSKARHHSGSAKGVKLQKNHHHEAGDRPPK